jgi:hypothetical protein
MAANIPNTTTAVSLITTPCTFGATQSNTTMAWFNLPAATSAGTYRDIVDIDQQVYHQILNNTIDYGTFNNDHTSNALNIGQWYHSCQVNVPTATTSRQIYGYLNGNLLVNVTDTDTWAAATTISIGNSAASAYAFPLNGFVRDVRVWNRALNAREILDEMNSRIPIHRAGLFLWVPLDDNLAVDKSGNNHILTVGSGITFAAGPIPPYVKSNTMRWI